MLVDIKEVRDGLRIRGANHPHTGVYINRNDMDDIVMNKTPWKSFDYGVCDDYTQVLEKYRDKIKSDKEYVIVLQVIHKQGQHSLNGWKWSKHGPYIGKQKQSSGVTSGGLGDLLGGILGNANEQAQGQSTNPINDILGSVLGGQQSGGGLGDILGSVLGGGNQKQSGGLGDLLGGILGGK